MSARVKGFALLAVLWVLAALTAVAGTGIAVARLGQETTRNRLLLSRAAWAREACVEIVLARYARDPAFRVLDTVDLGRGTWCRAEIEDPGARLSVNVAERESLRAALSAVSRQPSAIDSLVLRILERRRRGPLVDLREVPGLEAYAAVVTSRGTGFVNVNAASPEVLAALPAMSEEAVRTVLFRRAVRPLQGADELAGLLSPSARAPLLQAYAELVRTATFAPTQLVVRVAGGVRGTPLVARGTLTCVPVPGRLAVIRRETE